MQQWHLYTSAGSGLELVKPPPVVIASHFMIRPNHKQSSWRVTCKYRQLDFALKPART